MRRVLALTLFLGILVASAPASAEKPVREFLPAEDEVISDVCDFDLGVVVLENNELLTTFFDQEGNVTKQLVTGSLVVELRNEETGVSLVANIPGPGVITFPGDSELVTALGPWLWLFFPGDLGPGEPGMALLTHGRFVVEFAPDGVTIVERRGRQVDVCALLS
ncbi:MAG TPA: hypothetical protein VF097_06275 [Actinomycetota bacterium]